MTTGFIQGTRNALIRVKSSKLCEKRVVTVKPAITQLVLRLLTVNQNTDLSTKGSLNPQLNLLSQLQKE